MFSYIYLNGLFLLTAFFVWVWLRHRGCVRLKPDLVVLVIMLTLTAVFDTAIISAGIVAYHQEHIIGLYIGRAPIEDFAYTLVAAMLVPPLWRKLRGKYEHDS